MAGELVEYAKALPLGARVRVGVPLDEGRSFQEWGVVRSLDFDLLDLDLSRDFLPQQAKLEIGNILEVGLANQGESLRCRGMVVGGDRGHRLVLRLLDGFSPYEPREFFRQDVYLPLDYRLPPTQDLHEIKERWRQHRLSLEFAAQEPEPGETQEVAALRREVRERLEKRKATPPVAANISGNGVRLVIAERLREGMLVELSLYLPQPQRVVEIVGEVVQVKELPDDTRFSTALHYRLIDEADRDRLIAFISSLQLERLARQAPKGIPEIRLSQPNRRRQLLRVALGLAVLALLVGYEAHSIKAARARGEKHEIERVFEEGILQYLKQRR